MSTVTVRSRFNGLPSSGNGGYSCGVVASFLEGPAAVSPRWPILLDQALALRHEDDGKACAFASDEPTGKAGPEAPFLA